MKKTAMQHIIDRANAGIEVNASLVKKKGASPTEVNRATHLLNVCEMFKNLATGLLETEKQQIIDAGNGTLSNWHQHDCERHGNKMPDGEQYYNQTFQP